MFNITVHGLSELRGRMSALGRGLRGMVTQAIEEYAESHGVTAGGTAPIQPAAAKPAMTELPYGKASAGQKPGRYAMSKGNSKAYTFGGGAQAAAYEMQGGQGETSGVTPAWIAAAVRWAEEKVRQFVEEGR
jgi:hypothetical protein